tara:strand:+ start:760 stop:1890 length:1131 start_codon:yes stop_codon:yes gene_type:complete
MIFLDNNSTTKTDTRVVEKMIPFFTDKYGNSSSNSHKFGWEANDAIFNARKQVSNLINCNPDEIIFTSGATESNNIAIQGIMNNYSNSNLITSNIEHNAILDICKIINIRKINKATLAKSDNKGIVQKSEIEPLINSKTKLISLMHVNNEIGTIQPIEEIGSLCEKYNIIFHVDAAQSYGKINIDVKKMNIDLLSISGHKIYGPKGIGALYVNNKIKKILNPIFWGGKQEQGIRPGTLATPLIVGIGEATEICKNEMRNDLKKIELLRDNFTEKITSQFNNVKINGCMQNRISNNINLSFPSLNGMSIINALPKIALSNGSACTSSTSNPSHVLTAIGRNGKEAISSIRIGIGRFNNSNDISIAADTIIKIIKSKK